jgi:hypothetical protein
MKSSNQSYSNHLEDDMSKEKKIRIVKVGVHLEAWDVPYGRWFTKEGDLPTLNRRAICIFPITDYGRSWMVHVMEEDVLQIGLVDSEGFRQALCIIFTQAVPMPNDIVETLLKEFESAVRTFNGFYEVPFAAIEMGSYFNIRDKASHVVTGWLKIGKNTARAVTLLHKGVVRFDIYDRVLVNWTRDISSE